MEFGVHRCGVGHVVGPQRRRDDPVQEPGVGVEQGEDVSDGKPATLGLVAGLSKGLLEFGPIGHGEAGPVEVPGAVAVPPARRLTLRVEAVGDAIEQAFQEVQRQAGAGLDIGGSGEALVHQMRHVGARGVAVEHLGEKGMDRSRGIEESLAIVVTEVVAQLLDDLGRKCPTDGCGSRIRHRKTNGRSVPRDRFG